MNNMNHQSKKKDKKEKKKKKQSLADFYASTTGNSEIVTVKNDWNDLLSDNDEAEIIKIDLKDIPKQPKGSNAVPLERIPAEPPFNAFVNGIPYTASEEDVRKFFVGCEVSAVSMECGLNGRNRGSATVEFADQESLIRGLELDDRMLMNRTIHVSLDKFVAQSRFPRSNAAGGVEPTSDAHTTQNWRTKMVKATDIPPPPPPPREMPPRDMPPRENRRPYQETHGLFTSRGNNNYGPPGGRVSDSRYSSFKKDNNPLDSYKTEQRPALVRSETTPIMAERKVVDTNKLNALLTGLGTSQRSERTASIFGAAKPVDTAARLGELQKKMAEQKAAKATTPTEAEEKVEAVRNVNNGGLQRPFRQFNDPPPRSRYDPQRTYPDRSSRPRPDGQFRQNQDRSRPRYDFSSRPNQDRIRPRFEAPQRSNQDSRQQTPPAPSPTAQEPPNRQNQEPPRLKNNTPRKFVITNKFAELRKFVSDDEEDEEVDEPQSSSEVLDS